MGTLRQHATLLLARREHSRFELAKKLSAKGYESLQINVLLSELEAENLLSDERFAESYIRSRVNRGYGPYHIRTALQARHVSEAVINEFLHRDWGWYELAIEVRKKRFGVECGCDLKARAKQHRFLQGRGFSPEQINAAMQQDD